MNKTMSKDSLTEEIAKEVCRKLVPHIKKIVVEQVKRLAVHNKKVLKNELAELVESIDASKNGRNLSSYIFDEDDELEENLDLSAVTKTTETAKKTIAERSAGVKNGRARAKEIMDRSVDRGTMSILDEMVSTAEQPEVTVEGADPTYRPQELVASEDATVKDTDPANMDFGDLVDKMEERDKR